MKTLHSAHIYLIIVCIISSLFFTDDLSANVCNNTKQKINWLSLKVNNKQISVAYEVPESKTSNRVKIQFNILFSSDVSNAKVIELFSGEDKSLPFINAAHGSKGEVLFNDDRTTQFLKKNLTTHSVFWVEYTVQGINEIFCGQAEVKSNLLD